MGTVASDDFGTKKKKKKFFFRGWGWPIWIFFIFFIFFRPNALPPHINWTQKHLEKMTTEARELLDDLVWNSTPQTRMAIETMNILERNVSSIILRGFVIRELERWAIEQKNIHQARASKIWKILEIIHETDRKGITKLYKHHSNISTNYGIVASVIYCSFISSN